jgi:alanine racemase
MTDLPRWVEVDAAALRHNARAVRREIGATVRFSAVVKADGYGHGAATAARAALDGGADDLAVTYLDEALALRRAGVPDPLLVMGPVLTDGVSRAVRDGLALTVDDAACLRRFARFGTRRRPVKVHLKIDLGLRRWGVPLTEAASLAGRVRRAPSLRLAGIFAHPGYMVGRNGDRVRRDLAAFFAIGREIRSASPEPLDLHGADSAVLLDLPEFRGDRVRVGNLLYGINPTDKPLALKNPWRARARVAARRRVRAGETVGYGDEFVAPRDMTLATIPVGYAHGFGLSFGAPPPSFHVWIRGRRCPVVGRIGMGHCLVDAESLSRVAPGDVAEIPVRRTAAASWPRIVL